MTPACLKAATPNSAGRQVAPTLRTTSGRRKGVMTRFEAFVIYQCNLYCRHIRAYISKWTSRFLLAPSVKPRTRCR